MPTRKSSDSELAHLGIERMREALRNGTTHMEAKSGYGLNTETELRLLTIAESISAIQGLPIARFDMARCSFRTPFFFDR